MNPSTDSATTAPTSHSAADATPGTTPARDRYLDLWRAAALVRVVTYHVFGWVWLTVLFPAMGLMFALAGSLMAGSLDRGGPRAVARRLRRLLPPLWAFGAVVVTLLFCTGWRTAPATPLGWGELVWWVFPARTPPVSEESWTWPFNVVLWYIVTYLWLLLLSPALLAAYRRWPWRTIGTAALLPVASLTGVLQIGGYFNEQATNVSSFAACWLLGFAHHDGLLRRVPARRYAYAVAGLALAGAGWVLVSAASSGNYDLNQIPGANTLWSMAFVATVLRFRPRLDRVGRIRPLSRVIELLNARAVTIYLWHMPAGLVVATLLGSFSLSSWIGNVILRLAAVWLLTLLVVLLLGWIEDVAARRRPALLPGSAGSASTPAARAEMVVPVRWRVANWHHGMVTVFSVLAVGLAVAAANVWPGAPARSQNQQPQHETMRYLSDLVLVLDNDSTPDLAKRQTVSASVVEPGTVVVNGEAYPRAVVAGTPSRLRVSPPVGCDRLRSTIDVVGADDDRPQVTFTVSSNDVPVYDSGTRTQADNAEEIDVDITDATFVDLITTGSSSSASAIWADARFVCTP